MTQTKAGQSKSDPVPRFQPCPYCGRQKLYSLDQIRTILAYDADDARMFTCIRKGCGGQIIIAPSMTLLRARPATTKVVRRDSSRLPALAKSGEGQPVTIEEVAAIPPVEEAPAPPPGDETVTEANPASEAPAEPVEAGSEADTIAKYEQSDEDRRLHVLRLIARVKAAAENQEVFDGRFKAVKVAGQGATAVVIVAKHDDHAVALKVHVETALDDEEAQLPIKRAERAFEVQKRFNSPHVAKPLFLFRHPEFGLITVEDYVAGIPLKQVLEVNQTLSEAAAISIGIQAASVLVEAEGYGIIHRDIKPDNVLVQLSKKGEPHIHVIDFGLARQKQKVDAAGKASSMDVTSEHTQHSLRAALRLKARSRPDLSETEIRDASATMTQEGMALGTPKYMSPEQVLGGIVDHRSDIYCLGATLYHVVTSMPPFSGDSVEEILKRVILRDPVPAFEMAAQNGITISRALSDVLARAMRKDPDDRFQSPREFLQALEGCQPKPIVVEAPSKRSVVGLLAAIAFLLASIVLILLVRGLRSQT